MGFHFCFCFCFYFTLLIYSCFSKRYFGHLACASTRGLLFGSHALKQIYHWNKFRILNIQYPIANDPLPKQPYIELGTYIFTYCLIRLTHYFETKRKRFRKYAETSNNSPGSMARARVYFLCLQSFEVDPRLVPL